MQDFIARENIRRFQERLDACTDPEQKAVLSKLLELEQERLHEIIAARETDKQSDDKGSS